jgi:hypothetical protein
MWLRWQHYMTVASILHGHQSWRASVRCVFLHPHMGTLWMHRHRQAHRQAHTQTPRRHRHTQVTRTQANTKKRRMFFSEFCRLIQQVCSSLHNHIHLHGQQTGQKDTEQHQDKLPPVLHADGRLSSVCSQQAVAAYGHCMT